MTDGFDHHRREFLGVATMALAAGELAMSDSADARSAKPIHTAPAKTDMHTSFGSLKQIDAGLLNVGYAEAGPTNGKPVILLHGWPYDIYSFVDVAPLLAQAGYRVIVPFLRAATAPRDFSRLTRCARANNRGARSTLSH